MSDNDNGKLPEVDEDPFADLLGDELGEWDKMFDSMHEEPVAPAEQSGSANLSDSSDGEGASVEVGTRADSEDGELEITIVLPVPPPEVAEPVHDESAAAFFDEAPLDTFSNVDQGVDAGSDLPKPLVSRSVEALAVQGGITDADLGLLSESPESFFGDDGGIPIPMPGPGDGELDDDFYDGIEIDDDLEFPESSEYENSSAKSPAARGVAHVVRRAPQPAVPEFPADSGLRNREVTAVRENPLSAEAAFSNKTAVGPVKAARHSLELEDEGEGSEVDEDSILTPIAPADSVQAPIALFDIATPIAPIDPIQTPTTQLYISPDEATEFSMDHATAPREASSEEFTDDDSDYEGEAGDYLPAAVFSTRLPEFSLGGELETLEADRSDRSVALGNTLEMYKVEIDDAEGELSPEIYQEAGRISESLGRTEESLTFWDEVLAVDPGSQVASRCARRIERSLGQWDMADERLVREIEVVDDREKAALQSHRCDLLMALGQHDSARDVCKQVLSVKPNDMRALLQNLELAAVEGETEGLLAASQALAGTLADLQLSGAAHALSGAIGSAFGASAGAAAGAWSHLTGSATSPATSSAGALLVAACVAESETESDSNNNAALQELLSDAQYSESRVRSDDLRSSLHWLLAYRFKVKGQNALAQKSLSAAIQCNSGNGPIGMWLALQGTKSSEAGAEEWLNLASASTNSVWQSHAYYRASRVGEGAMALQALASAAQFDPESAYLNSELRRSELDNGNGEFVYARDRSMAEEAGAQTAMALYCQYESAQAASLHEEAASYLESGIGEDMVGGAALSLIGLHVSYASQRLDRLITNHRSAANSADNLEEKQRSLRDACRAQTRLSLSESNPSELLATAEEWTVLARDLGGHQAGFVWDIAISLASAAADNQKVSAYAGEFLQDCDDPQRKMDLLILAHADSPPASDEIRIAIGQASESTLRGVEACWSAELIAEAWQDASEVLENFARESEGPGLRDRSLYRSAYLRLQHAIGVDIAEESLRTIRQKHEAFCELLQRTPSTKTRRADSTRAPKLEDSDLSMELRRADALVTQGDSSAAANLLEKLRERHPGDELVAYEYERVCWLAKASAKLSGTLLASLRRAEQEGNAALKGELCEKLARVDFDLREDRDSAMMFWQAAANAQPEDLAYQRTLEREYLSGDQAGNKSMAAVLGRIAAVTVSELEKSYYLVQQGIWGELVEPGSGAQAYQEAIVCHRGSRPALFYLEMTMRQESPTAALAEMEAAVATYFEADKSAHAAFLVRSGEVWVSLEEPDRALEKFREALASVSGYRPALFSWKKMALASERWSDVAAAFREEAQTSSDEGAQARLHHVVGVVLMDKDDNPDEAKAAFRKVLAIDPLHRDAFVRLRSLLNQDEEFSELVEVAKMRIAAINESETIDDRGHREQSQLHHVIARLSALSEPEKALAHYREVLKIRPNDREAIAGVARLTIKLEKWSDAASALMLQVRLESDSDVLKAMYHQLGTIYTEHVPEIKWALRSYERVIAIDPGDAVALRAISVLGMENGDYQVALGACEQLLAQEPGIEEQIETLHRIAQILVQGFQNVPQAERALRAALDLDPSNEVALSTLVSFFVARNDLRSARIHIGAVIRTMHNRIVADSEDIIAYRCLARAMEARAQCGSIESKTVAIAAAKVCVLLGDKEPELVRIAQRASLPAPRLLASGSLDDLLWATSRQSAVRSLFQALGGKLSKYVGKDLKDFGVGRSDKLRKGGDACVKLMSELCVAMGTETPELYVARNQGTTFGIVAGRPLALVLGKEHVSIKRPDELRFLVGRAMVLAQAGLTAPCSLGEEGFGVLLVALLRYFDNDFAPKGVDEKAVTEQQHRLRKLMSTGLMQELAPYAMGLMGSDFDHKTIWQEIHHVANRAGLLCTGSISAAVEVLMRNKRLNSLPEGMQDAEIAQLVRFALSLEHGVFWEAVQAGG